jgi:hypothetical protein
MRVLKETFSQGIRISIFEWNQKYLIKYEIGPMEQTYKIDVWDVENVETLEKLASSSSYVDAVQVQFDAMSTLLKKFHDDI